MASKVFIENGQKNITIWISKSFTYNPQPRTASGFLTHSGLFYEFRNEWPIFISLSHFPLQPGQLVHSTSQSKVSYDMRDWNSSCLWYNLSNILDIFFWDLSTMYVSIIEHEKFIQYFRILFQKSTFCSTVL